MKQNLELHMFNGRDRIHASKPMHNINGKLSEVFMCRKNSPSIVFKDIRQLYTMVELDE